MRRRQTVPSQWLIVGRCDDLGHVGRLPAGTGLLLLEAPPKAGMRRLRRSGLAVVVECRGEAARVHNVRELRRALLARTPLILLSPIFPTPSHPDWKPLPRMRAAALARLGGRGLVALGGMDAKRFARIRGLGFQAWAGISAFRI